MPETTPSGSLQRARTALGLLLVVLAPAAAAVQTAARGPVDFGREVLPLLADRCYGCHGPGVKQPAGGLRLDVREAALGRGASGRTAIAPGHPEASELVARIADRTARAMPPKSSGKSLNAAEQELLRRWVAAGAPYRKHWAFATPVRPPLPSVQNASWARNPLDRFVLARLEREGLRPSPEAARETLIRRVTLDLTGLPPTPAEVDAFLTDRSPDAYDAVVERLLASPRYGERMAWDWLDAARYADTNGYQGDRTRTMWPWRDWVVEALNRNLPYNQFTVEQLAGDLLPGATLAQKLATGFHRNHMLNGEGGRIPEESRVDYVVDRVDTTATVWMGLTLGCSRCHDHKFDPFTQTEYFRLFAYFNNLPETGSVDRNGSADPVLALPTPEQSSRIAELKLRVGETEQRLAAAPDTDKAGRQKELEAARNAVRDAENGVVLAMVMQERPQPRDTFVLLRGAYDKPGEKVTAGVPAQLMPLPPGAPPNRLALARWLTDPAHPLTARVAVNRAWQFFFGAGLVRTAEDFGVQGEPATHPELLDWLTTEYVRLGWNTKALHRLLVTSATYRQTSRVPPTLLTRDPENRLLARGARFRLPSAVLRDQALAVSGLLVDKLGGPPVRPYQPAGVWEDATFGKITYQQDHGENLYRRSLYVFWRRIVAPTIFFDTASRQQCSVRQARTNTPLHALTLLNDTTYVEAARALAQKVLTTGGPTPESRLTAAFRLAAARRPSAAEQRVLLARLQRLRAQYGADPEGARKLLRVGESPRDETLDPIEHAAYTGICSLILNLDEVVTRE